MCRAWLYLITTSLPERLKNQPSMEGGFRGSIASPRTFFSFKQKLKLASLVKCEPFMLSALALWMCAAWLSFEELSFHSRSSWREPRGGLKQFYVNHHPEVNHHANLLASSQHSYYIYFLCEKITHFVSFLSSDANLTQMNRGWKCLEQLSPFICCLS